MSADANYAWRYPLFLLKGTGGYSFIEGHDEHEETISAVLVFTDKALAEKWAADSALDLQLEEIKTATMLYGFIERLRPRKRYAVVADAFLSDNGAVVVPWAASASDMLEKFLPVPFQTVGKYPLFILKNGADCIYSEGELGKGGGQVVAFARKEAAHYAAEKFREATICPINSHKDFVTMLKQLPADVTTIAFDLGLTGKIETLVADKSELIRSLDTKFQT